MHPRTSPPLPTSPDVQIESDQRVWSGRFPLDVVRFRNRRSDGIAWHAGEASEEEDIRVRVWPVAKAIETALDGAFTNSITAIGLLWLAARRDSLRQRWLAP